MGLSPKDRAIVLVAWISGWLNEGTSGIDLHSSLKNLILDSKWFLTNVGFMTIICIMCRRTCHTQEWTLLRESSNMIEKAVRSPEVGGKPGEPCPPGGKYSPSVILAVRCVQSMDQQLTELFLKYHHVCINSWQLPAICTSSKIDQSVNFILCFNYIAIDASVFYLR